MKNSAMRELAGPGILINSTVRESFTFSLICCLIRIIQFGAAGEGVNNFDLIKF